jgi:nudix-type nucleoside diphosphatase (YffH/AdpP family)
MVGTSNAPAENRLRDRVRILGSEVLSHNWAEVKKTTLEFRRRNGDWQKLTRETYDRGHGAGVLLHDPERASVVLTRQFRFPAWYNGDENPFLIEVCAGKLDGDDPVACAKKEAEEESGFRLSGVELAIQSYMSPGSVTEKLWLFVARYDAASKVSAGGGLLDEGEDIEVLEMPFAEALAMIDRGEIVDAKTIILLWHLRATGRMDV